MRSKNGAHKTIRKQDHDNVFFTVLYTNAQKIQAPILFSMERTTKKAAGFLAPRLTKVRSKFMDLKNQKDPLKSQSTVE